MRVAPIAPLSLLDVADTSNYLMALPTMADDVAYVDTHQRRRREGAFVILDNGVSELKTPLFDAPFRQLATSFNPSEIVLPDFLEDPDRTVYAARIESRWLRWSGYTGELMAVPQGTSLEMYMDCLYKLLSNPEVDTIGISKYFPKFAGARRTELLQAIEDVGLHKRPSVEWHLLGLCETVFEFSALARAFPWLRGIDTCYPVLASMMCIDILEEPDNIVTSPDDFFNAPIEAYVPGHVGEDAEMDVRGILGSNLRAFERAARGQLQ